MSATIAMPIHNAVESGFTVYTVLMAVLTGGLLAGWGLSGRRREHWAFPLVLAGGAVAAMCEPVFDNLVLFWYPPHQQLSAFHAFGRTVPICVVIGYAWFCGGLPYLAYTMIKRRVTARRLWSLAAAVFVIDFIAIGLTSWLKIAGFYGGQPFNVAGYPLWWGAVDTSNVLLGGALLYYLIPRLTGIRRAYLLLVPVWITGATAVAVAGPVAIALNSRWSMAGKYAAALITLGLGFGIVDVVASRLSRRESEPGEAPSRSPSTSAPRPALRPVPRPARAVESGVAAAGDRIDRP
jgi:hypothetical protein